LAHSGCLGIKHLFLAYQMTRFGQDTNPTPTNPTAKGESATPQERIRRKRINSETKKDECAWGEAKEFQNVTKAFIVGSLGLVFFLGVSSASLPLIVEQRSGKSNSHRPDGNPKGIAYSFSPIWRFWSLGFSVAQFDVFAPFKLLCSSDLAIRLDAQ